MEVTTTEQQDGVRWLLGAGLAGILIASFVAWSDHALSTSQSEKRLGETLRELRTAQFSLPTSSEAAGGLDERLGNKAAHREPAPPAVLSAGAKKKGHGHGEEAAHGSGH